MMRKATKLDVHETIVERILIQVMDFERHASDAADCATLTESSDQLSSESSDHALVCARFLRELMRGAASVADGKLRATGLGTRAGTPGHAPMIPPLPTPPSACRPSRYAPRDAAPGRAFTLLLVCFGSACVRGSLLRVP